MEEKKTVKRGEIYFCDLGENDGSVQNGTRPVLVVQCDEGNDASTTTVVAAITTATKKKYLPSHIYLDQNYGLKHPSMLMLEQLRTVNQSELINYVGVVDDEYMLRLIDNGLKKTLGLWKPKRKTGDIRCLCRNCLTEYLKDRKNIIKRVDPFVREKTLCSKCSGYGYEYIIISK